MDNFQPYRTSSHTTMYQSSSHQPKPIPHFTKFITQILYAIQMIRCKRGRGATLGEICNFAKLKLKATGDIRSRVETSIMKAKSDGFVYEKNGKFVLLTPLARMQNAESIREKNAVIRLMQQIFIYKANYKKRKSSCKTLKEPPPESQKNVSSCVCPFKKTGISKADVIAVLKRIESVMIHHFGPPPEDMMVADCSGKNPVVPYRTGVSRDCLKESDLNMCYYFRPSSNGESECSYTDNPKPVKKSTKHRMSEKLRRNKEKIRRESEDSWSSESSRSTKDCS